MIEDDFISKTRRKQQMLDLQRLGEELVGLSAERLSELALPEPLRDAVLDAKRIAKHGALRRQLQYIGRLMREVDSAPIQERLDGWRGTSHAQTALMHLAESWRARLIDDDAAFTQFAEQFPGADVHRLRALARAARLEHLENRPPKNFRLLFREIQRLVAERASRVST